MEKVEGSRCTFRTRNAEEKAKRCYEDEKRSKMEKVYKDIQERFEKREKEKGRLEVLLQLRTPVGDIDQNECFIAHCS